MAQKRDLGFVGLLGRVSKGVKTVESLQADEVHEHKIGRIERQTKTVMSFMSKYPPCMGATTAFSILKTYDDWRGSNGNGGFAVMLEETLMEEKDSFLGYRLGQSSALAWLGLSYTQL